MVSIAASTGNKGSRVQVMVWWQLGTSWGTALPGCGGGSCRCWAQSGEGGEEWRGWVCPATRACPRLVSTPSHPHNRRAGGVRGCGRAARIALPVPFPRVHARPRSRVSPLLPTAAKPPPPIGGGRAPPAPHRDVSAVRRRRAGRSRRCSAAGPGAGAVGKGGAGRGGGGVPTRGDRAHA